MKRIVLSSLLLSSLVTLGCGNEKTGSASAAAGPSASTSAAPSASAPRKPYTGKVGTVKGVVRIVGDDPPQTGWKYPEGCEAAAGMYGKLFRRGPEGQLADALVAVTGYDGWVPPQKPTIKVTIKDCAYSTRTIVLTHSQHIEINNLDPLESYLPHLDGAKSASTNVAVPRGPTINVYTKGHGRYWLRDQMGKQFMVAHVWHLPYSTAQVTTLDGRFEIKGVPVGKAKLSVMLPQTKTLPTHVEPLAKNKDIVVKEGDNVHDLELVFDAEKNTPLDGHGGTQAKDLKIPPATSASASTSAAPAPSAAPSATPSSAPPSASASAKP